METAEERLVKTTKFVDELLNKERFYKWNVGDVLMAVKQCADLGIEKFPTEKKDIK